MAATVFAVLPSVGACHGNGAGPSTPGPSVTGPAPATATSAYVPASTAQQIPTATPPPSDESQPAQPSSTAEGPNAGKTLSEEDSGSTVSLRVGDEIQISLDGNPSTGYEWEVVQGLDGVIQQVGAAEFESAHPGVAGAGGAVIFSIRAVAPGTSSLELTYRRGWETGVPPQKVFQVTIVVAAA